MRKIMIGLIAAGIISAGAWVGCSQAADEAAPAAAGGARCRRAAAAAAAPAGGDAGACCKAGDTTPPLDLIKATPKGGLHNPYKDQIAAIADAGSKKYISAGCNGCHGGGGGGGMCPPLTNDTWVYGPDDDDLFRLIALGIGRTEEAGLPPRQAARWWSVQCRPSAASSRPPTISGRSSPSSGRRIQAQLAKANQPAQ